MPRDGIILIVIAVMLVFGTIFAVIWWRMADVLFPGTAKKTGQTIFGGKSRPLGPPPGATVIKSFDSPAPNPPPPASHTP